MMTLKRTILPLAILGVVAVVFFAYFLIGGQQSYKDGMMNDPVPAVSAPPLHTKACGITPEVFRGHVTLVSFFASWCGPCHINHEIVKRLVAEHRIRVVGINVRDTSSAAQLWLMQHGNPYTCIGSDPQGSIARAWGVQGVPQMFLVDREGNIRMAHVGPLNAQKIEKVLLPLIHSLESASPKEGAQAEE